MKKIYLLLIILVLICLSSCQKKTIEESKAIESSAKVETNTNGQDTTEFEEAKKVVDSAFNDIKELNYENLSNKLSKADKTVYDKVMPNLMKNLNGDNRTFVEKVAKQISYEVTDQKIEGDNIIFKINVNLFKDSIFSGFLPSSVPQELDLTVRLIKENGEYKINNIANIADTIQAIIDSKKEK